MGRFSFSSSFLWPHYIPALESYQTPEPYKKHFSVMMGKICCDGYEGCHLLICLGPQMV